MFFIHLYRYVTRLNVRSCLCFYESPRGSLQDEGRSTTQVFLLWRPYAGISHRKSPDV